MQSGCIRIEEDEEGETAEETAARRKSKVKKSKFTIAE